MQINIFHLHFALTFAVSFIDAAATTATAAEWNDEHPAPTHGLGPTSSWSGPAALS